MAVGRAQRKASWGKGALRMRKDVPVTPANGEAEAGGFGPPGYPGLHGEIPALIKP